MVQKCIVCGAPQSRMKSYLSFHRFPRNETLRQAWLKACHLKEADLTGRSLLCSKHFRQEDYDTNAWPRSQLLATAVPAPSGNYFTSAPPSILSSDIASRRNIIFQQEGASHSGSNVQVEDSSSSQNVLINRSTRPTNNVVRFIGDLKPADFATPRKAKRYLDFVKREAENYRKKIKVFQAQKLRLEHKIKSFANLLQLLHEEKLISDEAVEILEGQTIDDIPSAVIEDAAQLVKANSIMGNKKNDVDVVYTMWSNLKKTAGMEVGQVGFHKESEVRKMQVKKRRNEIVNRLNKTKKENQPDFRAEREKRDMQERENKKKLLREQKKREEEEEKKRKEDAELRSYNSLMSCDNMNKYDDGNDSDDFM